MMNVPSFRPYFGELVQNTVQVHNVFDSRNSQHPWVTATAHIEEKEYKASLYYQGRRTQGGGTNPLPVQPRYLGPPPVSSGFYTPMPDVPPGTTTWLAQFTSQTGRLVELAFEIFEGKTTLTCLKDGEKEQQIDATGPNKEYQLFVDDATALYQAVGELASSVELQCAPFLVKKAAPTSN